MGFGDGEMEGSMSYPYPQDRHRDRKEKGEQPYKDDREAMARNESDLQARAEALGEQLRETDEDRTGRLEDEAIERLTAIQDERSRHSKTSDA
jgi:hypothetical protein